MRYRIGQVLYSVDDEVPSGAVGKLLQRPAYAVRKRTRKPAYRTLGDIWATYHILLVAIRDVTDVEKFFLSSRRFSCTLRDLPRAETNLSADTVYYV